MEKQDIQYFYVDRLKTLQGKLTKTNKQLFSSSLLRFAVFAITVFCIYQFFPFMEWMALSGIIGSILFFILLVRHGKLSYQKKKYEQLIKINQLEIDVQNGNLSQLATGKEFINPSHEFSHDVDLFGEKSFFQSLNRTSTDAGKTKLAELITSNDILDIPRKQEAIQNLSQLSEWRQDFTATASLTEPKISILSICNWLKSHQSFVPKTMRFLPQIFTGISVVLAILRLVSIIPNNAILLLWYLVGIIITSFYLKKINQLYENAGKSRSTFQQYHQLIEMIENSSFDASLLQEQQKIVLNESQKTSALLKHFAKVLFLFDQRNNMLFGFLANGFLLWDLWQAYKIEGWIQKHKEDAHRWFEVIAFFDAYNSMANYAFNHKAYIYPVISNEKNTAIIDAKALGHPLLKTQKRVDNDVLIQNEQFFIITGANMAGKSTFLRTVALQIIMGNSGLPVCASSCKYRPIKLISSMRTSDSLADDSSYFFSELTQLKKIVTKLQEDNYFIILDEILKGTNSKDKAEGSYKFVNKLVNAHATGIIATHDLSLCEISKELEAVENKYFDAQIVNDELYFDYQFKEGVCQNMNASFLLTKMGIV